MPSDRKTLSFILLHHLEPELESYLKSLELFFNKSGSSYEILLCSEPKLNETLKHGVLKENANLKLIHIKAWTRPLALQNAIRAAEGDFLIFLNADQSLPIAEILRLLNPFFEQTNLGASFGVRNSEKQNAALGSRTRLQRFSDQTLTKLIQGEFPQLGQDPLCSALILKQQYKDVVLNLSNYQSKVFFAAIKNSFLAQKIPIRFTSVQWYYSPRWSKNHPLLELWRGVADIGNLKRSSL